MKILIYSHFFSPSVGGVETIVSSLAAGLTELASPNGSNKFDVTVVTETKAAAADNASLPFRVVRQPTLLRLWTLIRSSDLVHLAGPSLAPMALSMLARKPTVIEHHGYQAVCPNGLLLHQPDRTVCPGHFQAGHYSECVRCQSAEMPLPSALTNLALMFPRSELSRRVAQNLAITQHVLQRQAVPRSRVLYYGVEETPQPGGPSGSITNSRQISFAYVGRLVPEKGLSVLVQATAILQREGYNLDVRLVGDGPERAHIQSMISAAGLDSCVCITGYLTGPALSDSLRDTQVVVMPSIWEETAGLAAIEQMMRGRLVIAADIGGLSEVVADAGLKFPPGNSEALAAAMRRVLHDPTLIESLGSKARERAKTVFNRRGMIEEHAAMYRDLVRDNLA
jgi:glycogen synthase